ncbi:MAG: hypothetical protein HW400_537 [Candidatus Levybacteria bacterium]|nr:hypothetical protein [Candidatus Levybacteria bacterium]
MGKMKKWIILIILILLTIAGFFYWKKSASQPPASNNKVLSANKAPSPSPSVWPQSIVININNVPIHISWAQVDPRDIELYDNLKEQKLSEEIKANRSCNVLVNGGFYSKENIHLGLFVSNFETLSKTSQSATRNGFLWIDTNDTVVVSSQAPNVAPRLGLQSGPLLMLNNQPLTLAINNDEPERRIVAGVIADNKLIFLVFYREQADFEGPLLQSLPEIINLFKKQTGLKIVNAINLDGGIHSVFASSYDRLVELEYVGSYFCAK